MYLSPIRATCPANHIHVLSPVTFSSRTLSTMRWRTATTGLWPQHARGICGAYLQQTNSVSVRNSTGDREGNASELQTPPIPRNDARLHKHTDEFPGFYVRFFQMTIIFWGSQCVIFVVSTFRRYILPPPPIHMVLTAAP